MLVFVYQLCWLKLEEVKSSPSIQKASAASAPPARAIAARPATIDRFRVAHLSASVLGWRGTERPSRAALPFENHTHIHRTRRPAGVKDVVPEFSPVNRQGSTVPWTAGAVIESVIERNRGKGARWASCGGVSVDRSAAVGYSEHTWETALQGGWYPTEAAIQRGEMQYGNRQGDTDRCSVCCGSRAACDGGDGD